MSTYLEKVEAAQKGIDNFYRLLNLYSISKKNQGWVGSENLCSNTSLDKFETYLHDNIAIKTTGVDATLFDIPMNSYGIDRSGRYGAGIPSDIGFCRNIKNEKANEFEYYNVYHLADTSLSNKAICYGNGKIVIIRSDLDVFSYSDNGGITWRDSNSLGGIYDWKAICYGNGRFVAVGNMVMAISTDGINWTVSVDSQTSRNWIDICYGGDDKIFVAITAAGVIRTTQNCVTYQDKATGGLAGGTGNWVGICYSDIARQYVAVSENGYIMFSTPGVATSWVRTYSGEITGDCCSICYGNGKFIVGLLNSNIFKYAIWSGDDYNFGTWYDSEPINFPGNWKSICYGNDKFVAVSYELNGLVAYSNDGISWKDVNIEYNVTWLASCYDNNKFMILSADDLVAHFYPENASKFRIALHEPLYKVTGATNVKYLASPTANTEVGGKIKAVLNNGATLTIYPNESSEGIEVYPIDDMIWKNSYKYMITAIPGAAHLHNLFCFVSFDNGIGGFVLYVTPNFINWNIHQIIPNDLDLTDLRTITGVDDICANDESGASIVQNILKKYFRVLPNNNYLIFYPLPMYRGEDKTTMATLYSPWQNEALMTIKDPYDSTEEYVHKAIHGISAYLTENGEEVLYYNNRSEMPLLLHYGRTMGTFNSDVYTNYKHEIAESPKIAKVYGKPEISDDQIYFQRDIIGLSIDLAINTIESKNGNLNDIPAASVGLAIGNAADKIYDNSINDFKHYNQLELFIDKSIDMMDNIDIDFNEYLFSKGIPGEKIIAGEDPKNIIYKGTEGYISDTAREWSSVCYGDGKFVAVANGSNFFAYSYDGLAWKQTQATTEPKYWRTVCYGNGKFVAAAFDGSPFLYSDDGITWKESNLTVTGGQWRPLCYGNGIFVSASYGSNIFVYSTDGINWFQTAVGETSRNWKSMCYGNGKFIALAEGTTFAYSTNGIVWEEITVCDDPDRSWNSICYGNGMYVAVVSHTNIVAYSTDGITWTDSVVGTGERYWYSMCYGNGIFVTIAVNTNKFSYSTDGITWIEGDITETPRAWWGICYGNGKFVAVARASIMYAYYDSLKLSPAPIPVALNESVLQITAASTSYHDNIRYRATIFGNSLYSDAMKVVNNPSIITESFTWVENKIGVSKNWYGICYGADKFVAIAYQHFVYSYDGITWTKITVNKSSSKTYKDICYGNGKFIAITSTNYFAYSTDGITWTLSTISSTNRNWGQVCYGNGRYVAIAYNSTITAWSEDGITWTECPSNTIGASKRIWRELCFGDGKFVAVTTKYVGISTDGVTWKLYEIGTVSKIWYSVCYGDGKFVAVTSNGVAAYSTDGVTWTEYVAIPSKTLRNVCYGGGRFVVIGDDGTFAYSTDAINWTDGIIGSTANLDWSYACYGNDIFVAVVSDGSTFANSDISSSKY